MKNIYLLIACHCFIPVSQAQTNVTIYAYSQVNSTGYVKPDNTNTSGNMIDITRYKNRGYVTFDLRTIPSNASISEISLSFYANGGALKTGLTSMGKLTHLPVITSNADVKYAEVAAGKFLADIPWDGLIGKKACAFNLDGIAAIQNRIGSFISLGIYPSPDTDNAYTSILGYTAGTGPSSHAPYLSITYTTGDGAKPATDFYAGTSNPYVNTEVNFYDNSGRYPTSWLWNFGDGTTSTQQNPVHIYDSIGDYTVTLKASNAWGDSTVIKTNYVHVQNPPAAPVAVFTADTTYAETWAAIQFTDETANQVTSWNWDFGDGNTSDQQHPLYTYSSQGVYSVTLIATGPGGSDTVSKKDYIRIVDVLTEPVADYTYIEDTLTAFFWDASVNYPNAWSWDFDALNNPGVYTSSEQHPEFAYPAAGTYQVCLIVSNPAGSNQVCKEVTITAPSVPDADFTHTSSGNNVQFTDASTNNPIAWYWNFGDGSTSTEKDPVHTYGDFGKYTVCLKVWNANDSDSICKEINLVTGMNSSFFSMKMHPNPASDELIVQLTGSNIPELAFINMLGQRIMVPLMPKGDVFHADISVLKKGIYLVKAGTEEKFLSGKLIIR